jgi:predicted nucleotidyltransferase
MLTRESIIQTLQTYFADKPVKRVWLFGSWARGEADAHSDVDVLVDLDYAGLQSTWDFFGYKPELEGQLHKTVDLFPAESLKTTIAQDADTYKLLIYEKGA